MDKDIASKVQMLQKSEKVYVPFCMATSQPFITCHAEDATDQVWVFPIEAQCHDYCKQRLEQNGDPVRVISVPNKDALHFYSTLFFLGVDEIVLVEEKDMTRIQLNDLVKKPNFDNFPEGQKPLINPQMQLSGIRLMQEVCRRAEHKPTLHELEDEMLANLTRSKFIVVTAMLEEGEDPATHDPKSIPCIQNKDGIKYQPIFSDSTELAKFTGNRKFKAVTTTFQEVAKSINDGVSGIVLNPHAINIIFSSEKIPEILRIYSSDEQN